MTMPAPLSRTSFVCKSFGDVTGGSPVLKNVSLEIRPGELTLLMGPSGSGKSTLLAILVGALRASSGHVELCGTDITKASESMLSLLRRQHVGFVFQSDNLFPALTALENVTTILEMKGYSESEARGRATEALTSVGLAHRLGHRPGALSGGQRQRVSIARALAGSPRFIVGDEITAALDGNAAMQVMEFVASYVSPSTAVLLVTHDSRLKRFAHRVVVMGDGEVASDTATRRGSSPS